MFINIPRDHKDLKAKQEAGSSEPTLAAPTTTSSNSRMSSTMKSERIVRVLGGKDRHSKVNTIRGLRDRRVRLSVPTAIQLYDLQDKLGVNQPSKAVDWLLNVTQHEIDKLPPLQFPQPANFVTNSKDHEISRYSSSSGIGNNEMFSTYQDVEDLATLQKSKYWYNKEDQEPPMIMGNSSSDLQNNGVLYGSFDHWQTPNSNIASRFRSSEEQNLQCQLNLNPTGVLMMQYCTEPVYFPARLGHFQAGSSSHQPQ